MHLQYGLISLRDRPWTQTAETLRGFVFDAERDATQLERRLLKDHAPGKRPRSARKERCTLRERSGDPDQAQLN